MPNYSLQGIRVRLPVKGEGTLTASSRYLGREHTSSRTTVPVLNGQMLTEAEINSITFCNGVQLSQRKGSRKVFLPWLDLTS